MIRWDTVQYTLQHCRRYNTVWSFMTIHGHQGAVHFPPQGEQPRPLCTVHGAPRGLTACSVHALQVGYAMEMPLRPLTLLITLGSGAWSRRSAKGRSMAFRRVPGRYTRPSRGTGLTPACAASASSASISSRGTGALRRPNPGAPAIARESTIVCAHLWASSVTAAPGAPAAAAARAFPCPCPCSSTLVQSRCTQRWRRLTCGTPKLQHRPPLLQRTQTTFDRVHQGHQVKQVQKCCSAVVTEAGWGPAGNGAPAR